MNIKGKKKKVQPLSKKSAINVLSHDELRRKVQVIEQELKSPHGGSWKRTANLIRMTNSPLSGENLYCVRCNPSKSSI